MVPVGGFWVDNLMAVRSRAKLSGNSAPKISGSSDVQCACGIFLILFNLKF
jgi:hypothetical protein